jgi:hypothetical protein
VRGAENRVGPKGLALALREMCMTAPEILPGLLELLEVEHGRSHSVEGTEVMCESVDCAMTVICRNVQECVRLGRILFYNDRQWQ